MALDVNIYKTFCQKSVRHSAFQYKHTEKVFSHFVIKSICLMT